MKKLIQGLALTGIMALVLAAQPASAQEVGNREARQQDRIAQGVRSGRLTPRETAHLETREGRINRDVHRDRRANGGHLTRAEHARIRRQQNRTSRAIARDKHNRAVR